MNTTQLVERPVGAVQFEEQLGIYDDHLMAVLEGTGLNMARFKATAVEAVMRNPDILNCTLPSRLGAVMTAANLALPVDGVHGAIVKFGDKAQHLSMYQGYVVLAGRGTFTLRGGVVHEGDEFDFDEPTGMIHHKRQLGNEKDRKVIAAWARSTSNGFPAMALVCSYDQILDARARSASWKNKGAKSIWGVDFAAMARKTPMRYLSKDIPHQPLQIAAAIETYADTVGRHAFIDEGGVLNVAAGPRAGDETGTVIDATPDAETIIKPPGFAVDMSDGSQRVFLTPERWRTFMMSTIEKLTPDQARQFEENNAARIDDMNLADPETAKAVGEAFNEKIGRKP